MVKDGEKELFFSNSLVITEPSEILLKSATVYWNYNNINDKKKDMDFINVDGDRVEFEHGYWSFDDIKNKLKRKGVTIVKESMTGKCIVSVDDVTYFKSLGTLLGLDDYTNMTADTTMMSPNIVDINRGLRNLDIKCDVVDKSKNIDDDGKYSDVIASLPIPTDKALKWTQTHYSDINSVVEINKGICSSINFKVSSNIDQYVGDILLELYIRKILT